ncbi:hypothetical protein Tco_1563527 [Tanacetum coccineum]
MSSISSAFTYTSVYTDFAPWRFKWVSDKEPEAPPFLDYLPRLEHPPSPDYVSGPEHPPLPVNVPYVPEPEYPEYLVASDTEIPIEDQPLPDDASSITLSPVYVADSDPGEDPEEDHADYPADGGDDDDESSNDDDDEDKDASKDEDDDEEEEEHLAPADSSGVPIVDPVPSAEDTKAFETDESAPTPPTSPHQIARLFALPTPPSSPVTPLSSPLPQIPSPPLSVSSLPLTLPSPPTTRPTYAKAPLGYKAEMPPWKRACFTAPAFGFEVKESLAVVAARPLGPTLEADLRRDKVREIGYGITNTWDEIVESMQEIALTTLEGVNQRVTELTTIVRRHMLVGWVGSEDKSAAIEAHIRTLEAQVTTLMGQTSSLQTQLTTTLRRIQILRLEIQSLRMDQLMLVVAVSLVSFVSILYILLSFYRL